MISTENKFISSGGYSIFYREHLPNDGNVKFVIQILHGMAEHSERYNKFAEYLTNKGGAVYISDHYGHGKNCKSEADYGLWNKKNMWQLIVDDIKTLNDISASKFPNVKNIILGHSMGSYIARTYISQYHTGVNAVVLSGTGYNSSSVLIFGKILAWLQCRFKGEASKAKFIDNLSFSSFNKKYSSPYQWLTRDQKIVDKYISDPLCGGVFSCSFYFNFFKGLLKINKLSNAEKIPYNLPLLFISGTEDPVGDYTKGIKKSIDFYKKAGVKHIDSIFYNGARHEILNEINKFEVFEDIYSWISKI